MADYANPDVLVGTDWLEEHLDDHAIRVVEVDEDTTAYEKGHIPGAVMWNWATDLHTPVGRDFADQAAFSRLLSEAGVGPDTTVVVYGGNNNWFAAYGYWLLQLRGFANVKLLDGGRKKWELESRALTRTSRLRGDRVRDRGRRAARDPGAAPGGDRRGRQRHRVRGRPFARGVPRREARARPPAAGGGAGPRPHRRRGEHPVGEGRERRRHVQERRRAPGALRGRGHHRRRAVIAYCRIGERAAHTWFALHELLGYQDVRNYDGTWTEYGSLVGVPVELG